MRLYTIVISVFLSVNVLSQSNIDSLRRLTNSEKNEELADVYIEIANYYFQRQRDSSLYYSERCLDVSENTNYKRGVVRAKNMIARLLMYQRELDTALTITKSVIAFSKENNYKEELNKTYNIKGLIYRHSLMYDSSLYAFNKSLEYSSLIKDSIQIAYTTNNIGLLLVDQNRFEEAIVNFQKAIDLLNGCGMRKQTSSPLNNIGLIYTKIGQHDEAIEYYKKALAIFKLSNQKVDIVKTKINIGNAYLKLYNNGIYQRDSIIKYYDDAYLQAQNVGSKYLICISLASKAFFFEEDGNYNQSEQYILEAIKLAKELDLKDVTPNLLGGLVEINMRKGFYDEALKINNEVFAILSETPNIAELQRCYHRYYKIYNGKKEYKKAMENLNESYLLRDSLYVISKNKEINSIESKYRLENKEKEVKLLELENQSNIKALKSERRTTFLWATMFVIIAFTGVIIFIQNLKRRRDNKRLITSNEIINSQRDILQRTIDNLELSNATKDKFFSIIAHDLKNPFGSILGVTELLTSDRIAIPDEKRQEILLELNKSAKITYRLLENLLTWARSQKGEIIINPELIHFHSLVTESIETLNNLASQKSINIINNVSEELGVKADKNTLKIVINNIVSNAIKFTPVNGEIVIESAESNDFVDISIADTGVGMTDDQLGKLFKVDQSQSTPGTNKEVGTGLGLILCKEFVDKNGGTIFVESEKGKGSKFIIRFSR
ncbi:MAG: tetratricopeptide repeat-containing sensor histidine kinase [Bacteroidales bacterium]|nr:tetratricopeptide repeat-containing sensor histidine kinase [Bacteroidales bacterium]